MENAIEIAIHENDERRDVCKYPYMRKDFKSSQLLYVLFSKKKSPI